VWLGEGGVAAPIAQNTGSSPERVTQAAASQSMTGRFTGFDEFANRVLLLGSDRAGDGTGTSLSTGLDQHPLERFSRTRSSWDRPAKAVLTAAASPLNKPYTCASRPSKGGPR
jgi:hypothetical protein